MKSPFTPSPARLWLSVALFWAPLPALVGCKGIPIRLVEAEPAPVLAEAAAPEPDPVAAAAIATAARAIQAGELADARQHLEIARGAANTDEQQMQIVNLAELADGAEAMMAGRGHDAAEHWGRIDDDDLRQQVSRAAGRHDIDVPGRASSRPPARPLATR